MAATLERTEGTTLRLVGEGETETRAEASVMLQGGDKNVVLLGTRAQVLVQSREAEPGGIAVRGQVDFVTDYRTAEGQLRQKRTQSDFAARVPSEGEGTPLVCATVKGVEAQEQDGRLDLSATILLTGAVLSETARSFVTHVDAGEYLACKTEELLTVAPFATGSTRELVSETFTPEEEAVRVATAEAVPTVEGVQFMEGTARIQGNVALSLLLATEDGALLPESVALPFDLLLDAAAFHREMQGKAAVSLRNLKADILYTLEKEKQETALRVEYVLEAEVTGWESREYLVLGDCYPLSDLPLTAVQEEITYISSVQNLSQTRTVPIGETGDNGFSCQLAALECGGFPLTVEGLLLLSPLVQEGEVQREVPFSLEFDTIPQAPSLLCVQVGTVQGETQPFVPVKVSCMIFAETSSIILSGTEETDTPAALPTGVILYYPAPGEDRWAVAKRYRVRKGALREGKSGSPLLLYRV